jgi:hypothetical protein
VNGLFLPLRISSAEARGIFYRSSIKNLFGLIRRRPVSLGADGLPSSVELLWLPAYAIRLELSLGETKSEGWVSVDANFGGFSLFERVDILEDREETGDCLPLILSQEEADKKGRHGLLRYFLRRRGSKPLIGETLEYLIYHAPVWVYYYRKGRKIDLKVLDGYSGTPMGGQVRVAIVNAFIARRREENA